MGLIKDIYSPAFYSRFADTITPVVPLFSKEEFMETILNNQFAQMEWKERLKHTTRVFHQFMPASFPEATAIIETIISRLKTAQFMEDSLVFIFFPDYIETYGLDDFDTSVKALENITQFISCEYAVRPFILKYGQRMIDQMTLWSVHENHKVRRLASEGCRPRLPWAMALPELKKDPAPILPLLENMKNDPSEWVRRSVANNINDIAKDHPDVVIALSKRWKGISKETDAVIKHGCRTLLKQGNVDVLKQYGLTGEHLMLSDFEMLTPEIKIGEAVEFSFALTNENKEPRMVRLEYGVYYMKAKGHLARKVFKISERIYAAEEKAVVRRKQPFKIITTRKFHPGRHQLSVIVNGEEKALLHFEVKEMDTVG